MIQVLIGIFLSVKRGVFPFGLLETKHIIIFRFDHLSAMSRDTESPNLSPFGLIQHRVMHVWHIFIECLFPGPHEIGSCSISHSVVLIWVEVNSFNLIAYFWKFYRIVSLNHFKIGAGSFILQVYFLSKLIYFVLYWVFTIYGCPWLRSDFKFWHVFYN